MVIRHLIEALALTLLFAAFRLLPLAHASWLGGFMARAIGPYLRAHRTAQKNLREVFPEKTERDRETIVMRMWDHLGRTAAELALLSGPDLIQRIESEGLDHIPREKAVLFFSGHIGNWELLPHVAVSNGVPLALVYRSANNPYVDKIIAAIRSVRTTSMVQKGAGGAVKMVRAIKSGQSIAMLVDQKMNDGIPVPFFGRDAMTAPALAQLALRYNMPIIPARVIRLGGAHFKAFIYPPLAFEKTGNDEKDALTIMTAVNKTLENWIREYPEQWFWVHQRWPKE